VTEVRAAAPGDAEAIAALCDEMDEFYGDPPAGSEGQRLREVSDALFASPPSVSALLAWDSDKLTGLAAWSYLWPAEGATRSLYLKELYVSVAARRSGTGALLMRELCRLAAERGCTRVEWTTDTGNIDAQAFYEALGVKPEVSKIFYRVAGDMLTAMAGAAEG
jgi:GNAT superfamily N-acetyltransferase